MASRRKSRGAGYNPDMSPEDRMKQWNIHMAERTLDKMFNHVDNGDVLIDNKRFKPVHYSAQALYEKAQDYFYDIIEQNKNGISIIPDVEDFCLFCNISRYQFLKYKKSDDAEMFYVANNINNAIANCKKSLGWHGFINTKFLECDFSQNHDYSSRLDGAIFGVQLSVQSQLAQENEEILGRLPDLEE